MQHWRTVKIMQLRFVCVVFIFLCVLNVNESYNFRDKLKSAIKKAKSIYKNKFGKDKTWEFLGHDMTEYPGTDKTKRKIQIDKWEEYYSCLRLQEDSIGEHGSIIPEAVLAFEGESIKLECKVCLSPSENDDMESVEWEWSHVDQQYLEAVDYGEHILISPEDKTLQIYNLGSEHTGQYVCKLGNQLTAPYFLTVANNSEPLKMVHRKEAREGPYAELPWLLHQEIVLDTIYKHWSPCSSCGLVGRRHKYGYCVIIYLANIEETEIIEENNKNITKRSSNNEEKKLQFIDKTTDYELSDIDREFLQIFKYGIPCRSHILPKSLRNIQEVKDRQSEIMIGYCKVKCEVDEVFVVKDKTGKIIESANNTAGIYSMVQGFPSVEPPVDRRLQFEAADAEVCLTCPGNLNTDAPIQWQIGTKNVVPLLLSQESNGRMYISITDRLYIRKTKVADSAIYSCWQNKELAGTIRLVIEKRLKLDFNHHIMLLGIIIILSVFLYIFIKAFFGRKYAIIKK